MRVGTNTCAIRVIRDERFVAQTLSLETRIERVGLGGIDFHTVLLLGIWAVSRLAWMRNIAGTTRKVTSVDF
jgi:hypothetical protein